jgi:hypothetical protein
LQNLGNSHRLLILNVRERKNGFRQSFLLHKWGGVRKISHLFFSRGGIARAVPFVIDKNEAGTSIFSGLSEEREGKNFFEIFLKLLLQLVRKTLL